MANVLPESESTWALAARAIERGELIVFPTDTVYGVASNPYDIEALERIYIAKGRPQNKAVPLLLSGLTVLPDVAGDLPEMARRLAARFWPGALTLVVKRASALPDQLGSGDTIAIRVPNHHGLRGLLALCGGALAATSANKSGEADPLDVTSAVDYLGDSVSLYVDGGKTAGNRPSTVVDCSKEQWHILREGAITEAEIQACANGLGS